ncbi:hypothetical protein GCM10010393_56780 [Streptomyces gobitricini]|uniref:YD repeat-containing protein n=1 Tax=Streptomyces gobitricini TaxID=68211 RepID=A0ABN3N8B8_9ACTN
MGGLPAETVAHTYGDLGQQFTSHGTTQYLQATQYFPQGDLRQLTLGTSSTSKKVYLGYDYEDGTRRLTRSYVTDDVHGFMPQELKFTQDDAGNVTSIFDATTQGGTAKPDYQCFTYDGHRRLKEAWTPKIADCAATGRTTANLDGAVPYWTSYTYNAASAARLETARPSYTSVARKSALRPRAPQKPSAVLVTAPLQAKPSPSAPQPQASRAPSSGSWPPTTTTPAAWPLTPPLSSSPSATPHPSVLPAAPPSPPPGQTAKLSSASQPIRPQVSRTSVRGSAIRKLASSSALAPY